MKVKVRMRLIRYDPYLFLILAGICLLMVLLQASLIPYIEDNNSSSNNINYNNNNYNNNIINNIESSSSSSNQQKQKQHSAAAVVNGNNNNNGFHYIDKKQTKIIINNNNEKEKQEKKKNDNKLAAQNNNNNNNNNNHIIDIADPYHDKKQIMEMLIEMNVDPYTIDNETWALVPTWSDVIKVWGSEPIVYGIKEGNNCEKFQSLIPDAKRRRIAVAGLFSTGTNLLAQLLQHNCGIPERVQWLGRKKGHGMEWQVPWGKHNPFRYRETNKVKNFLNDKWSPKLEEYFPVATIRDAYSWMSSMCRNPYTARWPHTAKNCPNFVSKRGPQVSVGFGADENRVKFDSLVDMYNVWNGEYYNETKLPRLIVRFEDLIFHPREVTKQVCECAGGQLMPPHKVFTDREESGGGNFHYVVGSSLVGQGHGKLPEHERNGLIDAWIKYSKPLKERQSKFSQSDLDYSEKVLYKQMIDSFGYNR